MMKEWIFGEEKTSKYHLGYVFLFWSRSQPLLHIEIALGNDKMKSNTEFSTLDNIDSMKAADKGKV